MGHVLSRVDEETARCVELLTVRLLVVVGRGSADTGSRRCDDRSTAISALVVVVVGGRQDLV